MKNIIELNENEKTLIFESINNRIKLVENDSGSYEKHIADLNIIKKRLDFRFITLTPMQKAIVIGCIEENVFEANQELLSLTDYELLLTNLELEKIEILDIGLSIKNKLQKKSEKFNITFRARFDRLNSLKNAIKICYSNTSDGNIYKVGIFTEPERGIQIETGLGEINNITIGKLTERPFEKSTTPTEFVELLMEYGKRNKLNENQKRILTILNKASV